MVLKNYVLCGSTDIKYWGRENYYESHQNCGCFWVESVPEKGAQVSFLDDGNGDSSQATLETMYCKQQSHKMEQTSLNHYLEKIYLTIRIMYFAV